MVLHAQKVIDLYLDVVGQTYLARRVVCGSTHVPKVVRVDLAGQTGVLHVVPHVLNVVSVDVCGFTCPKGAKGRPRGRGRSVFRWVHRPHTQKVIDT